MKVKYEIQFYIKCYNNDMEYNITRTMIKHICWYIIEQKAVVIYFKWNIIICYIDAARRNNCLLHSNNEVTEQMDKMILNC